MSLEIIALKLSQLLDAYMYLKRYSGTEVSLKLVAIPRIYSNAEGVTFWPHKPLVIYDRIYLCFFIVEQEMLLWQQVIGT